MRTLSRTPSIIVLLASLSSSLGACGVDGEDLAGPNAAEHPLKLPKFQIPTPPKCGGYHLPCCLPSASCDGGLKCVAAICVSDQVGAFCASDGDCGSGLSCKLGLCFETKPLPGPLAEPPPESGTSTAIQKSQRVLIFLNTTVAQGDPNFAELYRFFETEGANVLHDTLDGSYDQVAELKGSAATLAAFLAQLEAFESQASVAAIDVVVSVHGYKADSSAPGGYLYFADTDDGIGTYELARRIWNRRKDACTVSGHLDAACVCQREQKLRVFYSAACYGSVHMGALRDAGFKAVAGAIGIHADSMASFPTFLRYWKQGYSFQKAVDKANEADWARVLDNLAKLNPNWSEANSVRNTLGITGLQIGGVDPSCRAVDPNPAVSLYEHDDYLGYRVDLRPGRYRLYDLQVLGVRNDDISSIRVSAGYRVTVYADDFLSGCRAPSGGRVLTSDQPSLRAIAENDTISSIEVEQITFTPAVSLFQHDDYCGVRVDLPTGNYTRADLEARGMKNDDISSVMVSSGTLSLWEHDGYTGASRDLSSNVSALGSLDFNDKTSSITVR